MGYHTTNAALAYDYQDAEELRRAEAPQAAAPRFDVYTGAGQQADQQTSPAFLHVMKVFAVLAVLFVAVGLARVAIYGATNASLNNAASIQQKLDEAVDEGQNLEVMTSVYGSDARIRSIATGTLGMVEPDERVVLDVTQGAYSTDAPSADTGSAGGSQAE